MTAIEFIKKLETYRSVAELKKHERYFKGGENYKKGDKFMGVRMGQVFALAKEFVDMPVDEIEKLLENNTHEVRVGACSIMDKKARNKRITQPQLKELFDLYIRRHDRINTWDLVDLCAIYVVGQYLNDKPRNILYKLAKSKDFGKRRTSIVATAYFIRQNDLDDAYKIAEILVNDEEELINKATGWMLRFAGDKDQKRLLKFLDKYAATMPRSLLRNCIEKLDKTKRDYYLNLKNK